MSFRKLFSINSKKKKPKEEKITLQIGIHKFSATVIFMERSSLVLAINMKDSEIKIKVPHRVSMNEAVQFATSKQDWILRKISEHDKKHKDHIERSYENGATHLLFGERITLNVIILNKRVAPILNDNILNITVTSEEKVKLAVKQWYAKQAPSKFAEVITPIISNFIRKYNKSPKTIVYKFVKSYWGVCTSSGEIRLNIELLRAPKECIEYIIAHELCHLVHQNHSSRFYQLLTEFMPDWKERKSLLEKTISCKD